METGEKTKKTQEKFGSVYMDHSRINSQSQVQFLFPFWDYRGNLFRSKKVKAGAARIIFASTGGALRLIDQRHGPYRAR
jgi:hypothetical protein